MPRRSEPFSVPDPLATAWDEMVRKNRLLQARNGSGDTEDEDLEGGAGADRLGPRAAAARSAPIDPAVTDVFREGPDGRLHPIPGWRTTGPFDVKTWAHNIDWPGVLRDLNKIASRSIVGAGLPGLGSRRGVMGVSGGGLSGTDRMTLGAGVAATGDATLDAVAPKKAPPHR
jgi:hypothetical protein